MFTVLILPYLLHFSFLKPRYKYILRLLLPPLFHPMFVQVCFLFLFFKYQCICNFNRRETADTRSPRREHHPSALALGVGDTMSAVCRSWLNSISSSVNALKRKKKTHILSFFLFIYIFPHSEAFLRPVTFPTAPFSDFPSPKKLFIWWLTGKAVHIYKQSLLFLILSFSFLLFPVVIHFGWHFHGDFPKKRIQSDTKVHLNNIQEEK